MIRSIQMTKKKADKTSTNEASENAPQFLTEAEQRLAEDRTVGRPIFLTEITEAEKQEKQAEEPEEISHEELDEIEKLRQIALEVMDLGPAPLLQTRLFRHTEQHKRKGKQSWK